MEEIPLFCNQEIQIKAMVSYPYTPTTQDQAAKSDFLFDHKGAGWRSRQGLSSPLTDTSECDLVIVSTRLSKSVIFEMRISLVRLLVLQAVWGRPSINVDVLPCVPKSQDCKCHSQSLLFFFFFQILLGSNPTPHSGPLQPLFPSYSWALFWLLQNCIFHTLIVKVICHKYQTALWFCPMYTKSVFFRFFF